MSKRKTIVLLTVAVAIFMAFGIFLAYNVSEYLTWRNDGRATVENNNMVRDIFRAPLADMSRALADIPTVAAAGAERPDLSAFMGLIDALYEVRDLTGNQHIVAYLYIPGTNVNYLVMHAHNNSFYLNRDMFGHHNINGSLFIDYRNRPDFTDPNTIIYAHNMNNGNKFHDLRFYVFGDRYEFFTNHPTMKVVTGYEVLVYEIFSTFITHISFNYIQVHFEDDEFAGLVDELNARRLFDTGITATQDDNLLILSTCTTVDRNTRIVVASRLVQRIEINP